MEKLYFLDLCLCAFVAAFNVFLATLEIHYNMFYFQLSLKDQFVGVIG